MVFLETERLILRNLLPEDAPIMFDYRNNEACARYQRGQTKDLSGIKALVDAHCHDQVTTESASIFAVAHKDSGEMIGEINPNAGSPMRWNLQ